MNTSDILFKAADALEERGHCKHHLRDHTRQTRGVCLFGALNLVATGDPLKFLGSGLRGYRTEREYLAAVLDRADEGDDQKLSPDDRDWRLHAELVDWNNAPERTGAEVVTLLREAGSAALSDGQ